MLRDTLEGETAGTAIANMLRGIVSFDEKVQKIKDVQINLRAKDFMTEEGFKLEEFLISLRQELEKIQDPLKRMQVLRQLFDEEGMRAVAALLARNKEEALAFLETIKQTMSPEEYERLRKQIEEGGFSGLEGMRKAMDEQASLQDRINRTMNTWRNVKESFFGTLESLMAVVGSLFAEPLKKIFDSINNYVLGPLIEWIQKNQAVAKAIGYPIAAIVALGVVLGGLSLVIASVLKLFAFSVGLFSAVGTAIKALVIVFNALKTVIVAARIAMLALTAFNPVGLAIVAIATVVGAVAWLLWKNWDKVVKLLVSAWNWLKQNWQKLASFLMSVNPFFHIVLAVDRLVKKLSGVSLFDAGARLVQTLWQGIKSLANKPVEAFKEIVQKIRNMLPFSPAKEGPLRDIHRIKLVETIAQAIRPAPMVNAMRQALGAVTTTSIAPATHSSYFNINITINANSKDVAYEIEKQIRQVLEKLERERFRRAY